MPVYRGALEMELDEEEEESLMREARQDANGSVGGASSSSSFRRQGSNAGGSSSDNKKTLRTVALTACFLIAMYMAFGGAASDNAMNDEDLNLLPQQTIPTTPDSEPAAAPVAVTAGGEVPVAEMPTTTASDANDDVPVNPPDNDDNGEDNDDDAVESNNDDDELNNFENDDDEVDGENKYVYSRMATIVPDPFRGSIPESKRDELKNTVGHWHFFDGDEDYRPAETDYCANYTHRDIPGDEFPDNAWQTDAVFVNHYLDEADHLVSRAMEAIYCEYGYCAPKSSDDEDGSSTSLSAADMAERRKLFHWELVNLDDPNTKAPADFQHRGSRGSGGWTTERSQDGLVRRLLHAMMTADNFTVVMAGHSAAAGHGNHFHQSYMMQFHQVMAPIMARLGVKLISRNVAQGGLGTIQNAMGSGSLYGDEIDVLLWDSGMTEGDIAHIDLFHRQAVLAGKKVPVMWGGQFDELAALYRHADLDVGEFGRATNGIKQLTAADEQSIANIPYAARYMNCAHDVKDVCEAAPRFCAHCWVDRPDIPDPLQLFDKIASKPGSQVKWHPGWRSHRLTSRVLVYAMLDALQEAISIFSENTLGGPPLDEDFWHMTDYYQNMKDKMASLGKDVGFCYKIPEKLHKLCNTPMQARSLFTPRANPHETSLTNLLRPAPDGYVPRNTQTVQYEGPDAHNPCDDVPAGEVDVYAIVSGRRRNLGEQSSSSSVELEGDRHSADLEKERIQQQQKRRRQQAADEIVPGTGWEVIKEHPGNCDGAYGSVCGRSRTNECPMLGHHDSRGALVGNEYSGWVVMDVPNVKEGFIMIKIETWHKSADNPRSSGWTTVNNVQGRQRRRRQSEEQQYQQQPRPDDEWEAFDVELDYEHDHFADFNDTIPDSIWDEYDVLMGHDDIFSESTTAIRNSRRLVDYPADFSFDFAINGKITSWNREEFLKQRMEVQRVVEVFVLADDPSIITSNEPETVEVAFRLRGSGSDVVFGLTHIYWA